MRNILVLLFISFSIIHCSSTGQRLESSRPSIEPNTVESARIASSEGSGADFTDEAPIERKIIYTADVRFQAREKELEATREMLLKLTKEFSGYMLSSAENRIEVRVPSDSLQNYLEAIKSVTDNFYSSMNASDVTESFYDTEIRLTNARKMRERLLDLLKSAKNVQETLAVEQQLARVSEAIELYEGRLKRLKTEISMSKVNITFYKKYEPAKETEYQPGILGYPFYYAWKGIEYVGEGIVWLFVREKEVDTQAK